MSGFNSAYGFDFLYADALTPQLVAAGARSDWPETTAWAGRAGRSRITTRRARSRAGSRRRSIATAFARIKMLLLARLRGNIFIYQGEELGLPQVDVAVRPAAGSRGDRQLAADARAATARGRRCRGSGCAQSRLFERDAVAPARAKHRRPCRRPPGARRQFDARTSLADAWHCAGESARFVPAASSWLKPARNAWYSTAAMADRSSAAASTCRARQRRFAPAGKCLFATGALYE